MSVLPNPGGEKPIDAKPQQAEGSSMIFFCPFRTGLFFKNMYILAYIYKNNCSMLGGGEPGLYGATNVVAVVQCSCSLWMQSWHQSQGEAMTLSEILRF